MEKNVFMLQYKNIFSDGSENQSFKLKDGHHLKIRDVQSHVYM